MHTSPASTSAFQRLVVAAFPFENLSADPDQAYFADGLSEDIITALSLAVVPGDRPELDIRKVGKELCARCIIESSVRRSGSTVRVTAQFINAENGHHV